MMPERRFFARLGKSPSGKESPFWHHSRFWHSPHCLQAMGRLPPTQNALLQHSKRAAYQQYCEQSEQNRLTSDGHLMRTVKHGFQCGTQYLWPRRPACRELSVAARAKGDVHGARCACKKANWRCTELCSCHCEKD